MIEPAEGNLDQHVILASFWLGYEFVLQHLYAAVSVKPHCSHDIVSLTT